MYHFNKLRKKIGFLILASLLMLVNSSYAQTTCKTSGVTFIRQSQLDSFDIMYPNCKEAEKIDIYGTNIENIKVLKNLNKAKAISIRNTKIINLEGLNNLKESSIILSNNHELLNIKDIKNLSKSLEVSIVDCSRLNSFEGLNGDSIFNITLSGNNLCRKLDNINCLSTTKLIIVDWPYENLGGGYLPNIKNLLLSGVSNIDSINKFTKLEILTLEFSGLNDLFELNKNLLIKNLTIFGNENLANCSIELICNKINDPNFHFKVASNKTGCNTVEEIKEACTSSSLMTTSNKLCSFYPNPADGRLVLQNVPFEAKCNIIDLNGHVLKETGPFYSDKVEIDLNQLVPGMYILQIVDKQNLQIMFDKLVKI